jgi:hypothetical protein
MSQFNSAWGTVTVYCVMFMSVYLGANPARAQTGLSLLGVVPNVLIHHQGAQLLEATRSIRDRQLAPLSPGSQEYRALEAERYRVADRNQAGMRANLFSLDQLVALAQIGLMYTMSSSLSPEAAEGIFANRTNGVLDYLILEELLRRGVSLPATGLRITDPGTRTVAQVAGSGFPQHDYVEAHTTITLGRIVHFPDGTRRSVRVEATAYGEAGEPRDYHLRLRLE